MKASCPSLVLLVLSSLLLFATRADGERHISVGRSHACKTDSAGGVLCFGDPTAPQTQRFVASDVHAVTVGDAFSCSLYGNNATVSCWGEETVPEVAAIVAATTNVAATTTSRVLDFAAGSRHLCLLHFDGSVQCFGDPLVVAATPSASSSATQLRFRSISSGPSYSCGITRQGFVRCWGDSSNMAVSSAPISTPGLVEVACGHRHATALFDDGRLLSWGDAASGVLVLPSPSPSVTPSASPAPDDYPFYPLPAVAARYSWITAGRDVTCAVAGLVVAASLQRASELGMPRRTIECWGSSTLASKSFPLISEYAQFLELSCGDSYCFGLTPDIYNGDLPSTLLQWGDAFDGIVDFARDYTSEDSVLPASALVPVLLPDESLEDALLPSVRGISPRLLFQGDMAFTYRVLSLYDDWSAPDPSVYDDRRYRGEPFYLQIAANITTPLQSSFFLGLNPAITYLGLRRGRLVPPPGFAPSASQRFPVYEILPGTFNSTVAFAFLPSLDLFKDRWCNVRLSFFQDPDEPPQVYPVFEDGGCRIKVSRGSFHGLQKLATLNEGFENAFGANFNFRMMNLYSVDYGLLSLDFLEGLGLGLEWAQNASLVAYLRQSLLDPTMPRRPDEKKLFSAREYHVDLNENDIHHLLPMSADLLLPQIGILDLRYQLPQAFLSPVYDYRQYGDGLFLRRFKIHEGAFLGLCRVYGIARGNAVSFQRLNVYTETASDAALDASIYGNGTRRPVTFSLDVLRGLDNQRSIYTVTAIALELDENPLLERITYSGDSASRKGSPSPSTYSPPVRTIAGLDLTQTGITDIGMALGRFNEPLRSQVRFLEFIACQGIVDVNDKDFDGFRSLVSVILDGPRGFDAPLGNLKYLAQYTFTRPRFPQLAVVSYANTRLNSLGCPARFIDSTAATAVGGKVFLECAPAPAGTWSPGDGSLRQCPQGTFSDHRGQATNASCRACPAGRYNGLLGQSSLGCIPCPPGTASTLEGATSLSSCVACGAGTYSLQPGLQVCFPCPAGTFLNRTGAADSQACQLCPLDTFSEELGAQSIDTCKPCLNSQVTLSKGTSSVSGCIPASCPAGFGSLVLSLAASLATGVNTSLAGCGKCAPGFASPGGPVTTTACQRCPLGRFSDSEGAAICPLCPMGTVGVPGTLPSSISAGCRACAFGTRCSADRATCAALCPVGTLLSPSFSSELPIPCLEGAIISPSRSSNGSAVDGSNSAWASPLTQQQIAKFCLPCGASLPSTLASAAICLPGISQPLVSLDGLMQLDAGSIDSAPPSGRRLAEAPFAAPTAAANNGPDCGTFVRSVLQDAPLLSYSSQRVSLIAATCVLALLVPLVLFIVKRLLTPSPPSPSAVGLLTATGGSSGAVTTVFNPASLKNKQQQQQQPVATSLIAAPPPAHERLRDFVSTFDVFSTAHVPQDDGLIRNSPSFTGGVFAFSFFVAAIGLSVTVLLQLFGQSRYTVSVSLVNLPPLSAPNSLSSSSLSASAPSPLSSGLHFGAVDAHFLLIGPTTTVDDCPALAPSSSSGDASNWTIVESAPVALASTTLSFFGLPSSLASLTVPDGQGAPMPLPACQIHYRCEGCRLTQTTYLSVSFPQQFQSVVAKLIAGEAFKGCGPTTRLAFTPSMLSSTGSLQPLSGAETQIRVSPVHLLFGGASSSTSSSSSSSPSSSSAPSWFSSSSSSSSTATLKPAVGHDLAVMASSPSFKKNPYLSSPTDGVSVSLLFQATPYATLITATDAVDPLFVVQSIIGFVSGLAAAFAIAMRLSEHFRKRVRSNELVLNLAIKRKNRCCLCLVRCLAGSKGVEEKVRISSSTGFNRGGAGAKFSARRLQGSFAEALRSFGIRVSLAGGAPKRQVQGQLATAAASPTTLELSSRSGSFIEMGESQLAVQASAVRGPGAGRASTAAAGAGAALSSTVLISRLAVSSGKRTAGTTAQPRKGSVRAVLTVGDDAGVAAEGAGASSRLSRAPQPARFPALSDFEDSESEADDGNEGEDAPAVVSNPLAAAAEPSEAFPPPLPPRAAVIGAPAHAPTRSSFAAVAMNPLSASAMLPASEPPRRIDRDDAGERTDDATGADSAGM